MWSRYCFWSLCGRFSLWPFWMYALHKAMGILRSLVIWNSDHRWFFGLFVTPRRTVLSTEFDRRKSITVSVRLRLHNVNGNTMSGAVQPNSVTSLCRGFVIQLVTNAQQVHNKSTTNRSIGIWRAFVCDSWVLYIAKRRSHRNATHRYIMQGKARRATRLWHCHYGGDRKRIQAKQTRAIYIFISKIPALLQNQAESYNTKRGC